MAFITLMTDFGIKDGNVAIMKGVIWQIAPNIQIADISHMIKPQNITEAALILWHAAPYFPQGTVHIVVVDPGVGTYRRPIAVSIGPYYFVGPDNGVITYLLEFAKNKNWSIRSVHLNNDNYFLPQVSNVFHGRDIFAPVGAYIASGKKLNDLGSPITDKLIVVEQPSPKRKGDGWLGEIIHIDHFGNIVTNISKDQLGDIKNCIISLCATKVTEVVRTFGERPPNKLIALFGGTNQLIVSIVNGNAANRLKAKVGDMVEIIN